ncbi:hypothetical protein PVAP13_7KG004736 [Panicum virgatum]|uniref:Uncharacterized protein n=1 Tax=Panicum virgatum TaxID=38727 RepID=A0A8T0QJU1_PANVG|nr:hypothetical protein PVAP13_7KG004736 [Panicum virgatum]
MRRSGKIRVEVPPLRGRAAGPCSAEAAISPTEAGTMARGRSGAAPVSAPARHASIRDGLPSPSRGRSDAAPVSAPNPPAVSYYAVLLRCARPSGGLTCAVATPDVSGWPGSLRSMRPGGRAEEGDGAGVQRIATAARKALPPGRAAP